MDKITSPANAGVKYVASLADAKTRRRENKFVLEGDVMIAEALKQGLRPESVWLAEDYKGTVTLPADAPTRTVARAVFQKMSDTVSPQGILAVFDRPAPPLSPPEGDAVILDGIRDPGNLGTIIRTSAACGVRDLYLIDCVDVYNPKTVRATMTGLFFVRCHECGYEEIAEIVVPHVELWVADMDGENLFDAPCAPKRVAVAIGNEAHGVSRELRAMAHRSVALPMQNVESLNAAVSASVILYELGYHLTRK